MSEDRYLDWIRTGLKKPGKTQIGLARHLGIAHPQITMLLRGERKLKVDEVPKIAAYLEEPEPPLMVPIVGLAGAGPGGTVVFSNPDEGLGEAAAPPNATDTTVALEVRGDSMRGVAEDGWLVFFEDPTEPTEEMLGEPCVCFLEDGRVLIKYLHPGRDGLFDLESASAPTMRDVAIRKAALITSIVPRRSAQRHIRRRPDLQPLEVDKNGHPPVGKTLAKGRRTRLD